MAAMIHLSDGSHTYCGRLRRDPRHARLIVERRTLDGDYSEESIRRAAGLDDGRTCQRCAEGFYRSRMDTAFAIKGGLKR